MDVFLYTKGCVLLDKNMKLVKPVGDYLDYKLLRGKAEMLMMKILSIRLDD